MMVYDPEDHPGDHTPVDLQMDAACEPRIGVLGTALVTGFCLIVFGAVCLAAAAAMHAMGGAG